MLNAVPATYRFLYALNANSKLIFLKQTATNEKEKCVGKHDSRIADGLLQMCATPAGDFLF